MMRCNITVLLHVILGLTTFWSASTGFSVMVTTNPAGPSYKAATLFTVQCLIINGSFHYSWYYYEWTYGCSYTGGAQTVYRSGYNIPVVGYFATTNPYSCRNVFTCKATDNFVTFSSAVEQIKVEIVTDIGIQILPSPYAISTTRNISILTVNESGKFLDIACASGLRQPSLGKWIHPNGTEIGLGSEKYSIERGGGVTSLPYATLKLKDDYSAVSGQDTGLYTCKMLDLYQVERESHIWILPEDDFDDPVREYFTSFSGTDSLTLKCAFSSTPGEITWYIGLDEISSNDQYKISQRLLQSSPYVLYEGVLEVAYIDIPSSVLGCRIYSSIIGNHADPFPSAYTISEIHYFFLSTIGQSETFVCTFAARNNITNTEVYHNGVYVTSNSASNISYTIELVKDTTHNEEYSCIGINDEGNATRYVYLSIVALIPKHAIVMHGIVPEDAVLAGEPVTLSLSAVKATGFTFDQTIRCTDWNGDELSEIEGIDYPDDSIVGGLTLSIQVQIPSIRMSRAGKYYCDAILETPTNLDNISDSINFTLEVKAPTPVSLANSVSSTTVFKAGSTVLFRCNASLNLSSFIDVPTDCIFKWIINGTTITSAHTRYSLHETIAVDSNSSSTIEWYSQLQIAPVLKIDESDIDCSARIVADIDTNAEHIVPSDWIKSSLNIIVEGSEELTTVPVKITFAGEIITSLSCSQLLLYSAENKMLITDILVAILVESCSCHYLPNFIANQRLLCNGSDDSSQLLSYKAELYSTDIVDASVLGGYLQNYDWANSTEAQNIALKINENQNIVLAVNKKCQVVLNDDSSARCDSSTEHSSYSSNTLPSPGLPSSTKITKSSSTASSLLATRSIGDDESTIATAHTPDSTPLIIYTVSGLVSVVFISCLSCVFIIGLIVLLRKRKTSERIIINSNLTSNVVQPEEAACYTTTMNNYTYDTWNNESEINKRQLPKLPVETRMDEIDRIKHDNRFRGNLHDHLSKQDSEIYTEMDGGLVHCPADYEDPQQQKMDCDDDGMSHNYEDLEKYQKELDGVYVKPFTP